MTSENANSNINSSELDSTIDTNSTEGKSSNAPPPYNSSSSSVQVAHTSSSSQNLSCEPSSAASTNTKKAKNWFKNQKGEIKTPFIALISVIVLLVVSVLAIFAIVLFVAFIPNTQDLDTTATLQETSFNYPNNWNTTVNDNNAIQVVSSDGAISARAEIMTDVSSENLQKLSEGGVSASSYLNSIARGIDKSYTDPKFETINSCEVLKFNVNSVNVNGTKYYGKGIITWNNKTVTSFMVLTSLPSYETLVECIADSLTCTYHAHTIANKETTKEATCTETGSCHGICAGCNRDVVEIIQKLPHTLGDWTVEANYTIDSSGNVTPGKEVRKCTVCGQTAETRSYTTTVTTSQKNACKTAASYLKSQSFSYSGLVEQLEYEKFSHDDAVFAVDHCGADWNEQATKTARSYLRSGSFSRDRLIEQLEFEGFTNEQAVYGVNSVGL